MESSETEISEIKQTPIVSQNQEKQEEEEETGEKHEIQYEWTFWYVYTLSHNEKKK